jgi:hypothetical protein
VLKALQDTVCWRRETLLPLHLEPLSPYFRCLPSYARDPFGRPIVVLQIAKLFENSSNLKHTLLHVVELMRLHLVRLNQIRDVGEERAHPVMQYVALLNVRGMPLNNMVRYVWYGLSHKIE